MNIMVCISEGEAFKILYHLGPLQCVILCLYFVPPDMVVKQCNKALLVQKGWKWSTNWSMWVEEFDTWLQPVLAMEQRLIIKLALSCWHKTLNFPASDLLYIVYKEKAGFPCPVKNWMWIIHAHLKNKTAFRLHIYPRVPYRAPPLLYQLSTPPHPTPLHTNPLPNLPFT